ncbi:hypothetical protein PS691_03843 [Pseudomonas fluorescens]|uniref:Uncharacterized protein n=2 Tax=Pseudomonas fluorescens TaxID=294 RepID=A0A5E7DIB7_PSEFL|nr:hypothetical protein PS691_03843 [Pseudomonas fluorescens]
MTPLSPDIYIVNGNITLFLGSHPESFKKDVLHSALLGQLVAESDNTSVDTWFAAYKKILSTLFWSLNSFENKNIKAESFSVLSLAQISLSKVLHREQLQQLTNALSIIKQLPDDSPAIAAILNKLQKKSIPTSGLGDNPGDEKTTVTISTLLTIVCENKTIISFQASFESSHTVDITILDQALPENNILGAVEITLWSTCLIEAKYASVRNQVIEKLGSKSKTHLLPI